MALTPCEGSASCPWVIVGKREEMWEPSGEGVRHSRKRRGPSNDMLRMMEHLKYREDKGGESYETKYSQ